jgi:TolB protein
VPGEVRVLPGTGYTIEFTASALLAPLTTYTLTVSPTVTNLAGTSLGNSSDVTFTTATSAGSGPVVGSVKVSPDSATINAGAELQLMATLTDTAGQIVTLTFNSVTWSSSAPDVVTVLGGGWVIGIGTGTAIITARSSYDGLTGTARIIVNPSPVGAIATTTCDDQEPLCGLYSVDPDGSNGRYLTSSYLDTDPVWSPDGRSIAFRSQRGCDRRTTRICHNDLYVMKADGIRGDGSGLRSLTTGSGLDVGGMSWSPDGSRIVFAGSVFPTDLLYPPEALYLMNADGSDLRLLVSGPAGGSASWPDWSPDGSKIAYNVVLGDTSAIDVVDADGSSSVRISTPSASRGDRRPHWSPDGKRIAFTRSWSAAAVGNGTVSQVFVMDADGSNVRQITHDSAGARYPVWSPDGTRLALIAGDLNGWGIINIDGSGRTSLPVCCPNDDSAASWRRAAAAAPSVSALSRVRPHRRFER